MSRLWSILEEVGQGKEVLMEVFSVPYWSYYINCTIFPGKCLHLFFFFSYKEFQLSLCCSAFVLSLLSLQTTVTDQTLVVYSFLYDSLLTSFFSLLMKQHRPKVGPTVSVLPHWKLVQPIPSCKLTFIIVASVQHLVLCVTVQISAAEEGSSDYNQLGLHRQAATETPD